MDISRDDVSQLLNERLKGYRGRAHRAAVLMGFKKEVPE
jgi:gp16 family phage-associated protein